MKNRRALIVITVILLLFVSYYVAYLLRFAGDIPPFFMGKFKRTVPLVVMIELVFLAYFGQLEGYWRYVGLNDVVAILKSMALTVLVMFGVEYFFLDASFPTGTVVINFLLGVMLLSGQRLSTRLLREAYTPITPKARENVLILGAGDRGERLLRELRNNPDLAFNIIGFIDKDPAKQGKRIHGTEIIGQFASLPELVESHQISILINTLDALTQEQAAILTRLRAQFKCTITNVPAASDYITGKVSVRKWREASIEELLGRKSVELDRKSIESIFKDKRVLVTGAGGSIGSELVRQLLRFSPGQMLLLDKDETLLYELETELNEGTFQVSYQVLMGDIRNKEKMAYFFKQYRPEVVLHAAAYKHVPLMELHPQEAIQNNIIGTRNILEAARDNGVERIVMISTDKAVRPTNVMGATKRFSEMLMFGCFAQGPMKCMAVRFGNVLGSRGSVIPLFTRQINRGGPVRITHPDITRFFMSIPEAAQLVLQAGAMGKGGEIFILKMGEPVLIKDLATRLIEISGYQSGIDIDIEYVGLRPGEKLHEELLTELEGTHATPHEKILVIHTVPTVEKETLLDQVEAWDSESLFKIADADIKHTLKSIIPEYIPFLG
ncbi:MAG: hypothetical protein A2293_14675 [Elusimicrobia bacterium RIFOXYB2_FULL_49_7]|nr:MAG: hypothetical protein A2293_14675 [Elusimicrobia bacterium RIFOXYB2_FULL_49_7]